MSTRPAPSLLTGVLALALLSGGVYAALRAPEPPETKRAEPPSEVHDEAQNPAQQAADPHAGLDMPIAPEAASAASAPGAPPAASSDDDAHLAWTVPSAWKSVPNPSSMRLATYHAPHAASDADDVEISVTRAGGSADANIQRWAGQFQPADGPPKRASRNVRSLAVSTAEISGTYLGGGPMMGGGSAAHPGWTLVGAIVEAPDGTYFFKMTGPSASVRAARGAFDAMIASLGPKP